MQRVPATRKQYVFEMGMMLLAIATSFPIAMSGKLSGILFWIVAAVLGLTFVVTRIKAFVGPLLVCALLFAASFALPLDVVVEANRPFRVSWERCRVVGMRSRVMDAKMGDVTEHVINKGCCPVIGVEPTRVLKIGIPWHE